MMKIPLSQGEFALVDDVDFDWLSKWNWHLFKGINKTLYAKGNIYMGGDGSRKSVLMHRFILGIVDPKIHCDHRNLNGLDNKRKNLRESTRSQNMANQEKQANNTSGYKGVCWHKGGKIWRAQIGFNGTCLYVGSSKNKKQAAQMYNEKARELFGEFAKLNKV